MEVVNQNETESTINIRLLHIETTVEKGMFEKWRELTERKGLKLGSNIIVDLRIIKGKTEEMENLYKNLLVTIKPLKLLHFNKALN